MENENQKKLSYPPALNSGQDIKIINVYFMSIIFFVVTNSPDMSL